MPTTTNQKRPIKQGHFYANQAFFGDMCFMETSVNVVNNVWVSTDKDGKEKKFFATAAEAAEAMGVQLNTASSNPEQENFWDGGYTYLGIGVKCFTDKQNKQHNYAAVFFRPENGSEEFGISIRAFDAIPLEKVESGSVQRVERVEHALSSADLVTATTYDCHVHTYVSIKGYPGYKVFMTPKKLGA